VIRPVQPTDALALADGFTRLSVHSRWMRFLTAKDHLSPAELRFFTEVDHHEHEALVALSLADRHGVGIARYVRHADDSQAAEVAVTVVDAWHGRGLGTELLTRLTVRARQEGIFRLTALIAADNVAMLALLRTMKPELAPHHDVDTVEYEVTLTQCRCAVCGQPADPVTNRVQKDNQIEGRWICHACIRAHVPVIAAELTQPWWK
jgi:RimJ/RimL family protein N-acetyltransferase